MINEIELKAPGCFEGDGAKMSDVPKVNFVFGANGTGKTTLSSLIRTPAKYPASSIGWKDNRPPLEALVYNRDFVGEELFGEGKGVKGVYTMGKVSKENQKKVETAQEAVAFALSSEEGARNALREKEEESDENWDQFSKEAWKLKDKLDSVFPDLFAGVRNNKKGFATRFLEKTEGNVAKLRTFDELEEEYKRIFVDDLRKYIELKVPSGDFLTSLANEEVLTRSIVGSGDVDLKALIEHLDNSDWVAQGVKYIDDADGKCPFCQQGLLEDRRLKLEKFFDESYAGAVRKLEGIRADYDVVAANLIQSINDLLQADTLFLDRDALATLLQTLEAILEANKLMLGQKVKEPSKSITLQPIEPTIEGVGQVILKCNEATRVHNLTIENISSSRDRLEAQLWRYCLEQIQSQAKAYKDKDTILKRAIQSINERLLSKTAELAKLRLDLHDLEKAATSIELTVTAINGYLKRFGFKRFSLRISDDAVDKYQIVRANGEDARKTLSEGEKTLISFLYFYHLVAGSHEETGTQSDRIIVIDDPVSSVDSDVLFIISTLVKDLIEKVRNNANIKQIFVLTHNVYFHHQVVYDHKDGRGQGRQGCGYWMFLREGDSTKIERSKRNQIRSAYELLWETIRNPSTSDIGVLGNNMRRILEHYFTFLGGDKKLDSVWEEFDADEQAACRALISWAHSGSHLVDDDLHAPAGTANVYKSVFRRIFELKGQIDHYKLMMKEEGQGDVAA